MIVTRILTVELNRKLVGLMETQIQEVLVAVAIAWLLREVAGPAQAPTLKNVAIHMIALSTAAVEIVRVDAMRIRLSGHLLL
jgi:hypothetical protein